MSTTHPARRALVCLGVALAIITAGCSSSGDPVPGNTTSTPMAMDTNGAAGGIDRTDPAAVAAAFATYFAAGDTPSACQLASSAGVKQINGNWGSPNACSARQPWSTAVKLTVHCSGTGGAMEYLFRTNGSDEINTSTYLDLLLERAGGAWQVTTAAGLASSASPLPCKNG